MADLCKYVKDFLNFKNNFLILLLVKQRLVSKGVGKMTKLNVIVFQIVKSVEKKYSIIADFS